MSHAESDRLRAAFEAHAAHLHDYCRSLLDDKAEAAGAAEATLVIAFSILDRLQDAGRIRGWLLALARRECLSTDPARLRLPERPTDRGRVHSDAEPGRTARTILNALPAAEREALDLVYRHYLSSADVADVLGVSVERARALLDAAVTKARAESGRSAPPAGTAEALVTGIRVISTIPLLALPPSILLGAGSIVGDPDLASYRDSLASSIGNLGPDGFPMALPQTAVLERAVPRRAVPRRALRQGAAMLLAVAGRMPRARLILLGALLLASSAAVALFASSSSGTPNSITHANGQAPGQDPAGSGTGRRTVPLPITAPLPKKQDHGIMLPMTPAAPSASHKPSPAPTKKHPVASSPAPTPTSPSPAPTSASPSPTSPSPTSTIPTPTPTVTP